MINASPLTHSSLKDLNLTGDLRILIIIIIIIFIIMVMMDSQSVDVRNHGDSVQNRKC